jgi:hypothetical protein
MGLTSIQGIGVKVIGDITFGLFPESIHPNVMALANAMSADGYAASRARIDACNNFVYSLIANGLWDKMDAMYPFLGGTTAITHKWNLKNVIDTDAAFRISWTGAGLTFTEDGGKSTGAAGNAGNTFYTPSINQANTSSVHLSAYINVAPTVNSTAVMGVSGNLVTSSAFQIARFGTGLLGATINARNATDLLSSGVATAGFYCGVRPASNSTILYRNGISVASNAGGSLTVPTSAVLLFSRSINPIPSNAGICFASLGSALTARESLVFYNLVQAFQTSLGRAI